MGVPTIVEEANIWELARRTIDEHGAGAWLEAAMQIDAHTATGDLDGASTWRRIANVIAQWDDIGLSAEN